MAGRRWYLWLAGTGILMALLSSTILDFLPSRHTVSIADYRYETLDWVARAATMVLIVALTLWLAALWPLPGRGRIYVGFLILGVLCFLLVNFGSVVYAKNSVLGTPVLVALRDGLFSAANAPGRTTIFIAPFLLIGLISALLAHSGRPRISAALFVLGAAVLAWFYFSGYKDAEIARDERKWTASALALGLVPFKSLALVGILYVVSLKLTEGSRRIGR